MRIVIKAKQSGFTLLEVLLGMSIMSIMMLLLFASLRICVQNWNAGEKKIAQVSQAAIVQGFLQNKLQAALPLDADFLEEEQFSFQGDKEKMQFVAAMPASA
ncbi:MAG: prepilin-type N-terminal cleavage/methylation domain-containing protein, partial [Methyloprofundus sp.]|nr:prepilin-type N-terminal cleavage/methylation domain-containing protein [Methyloprofundus sp.]